MRSMQRILVFMAVILTFVMMGLVFLLGIKWKKDRNGAREYQVLRRTADMGTERSEDSDLEQKISLPRIRTEELCAINGDYTAWLYIPDTGISYPVVWTLSNHDYLEKTFAGERNSCGTLFFDCAVQPFTSLHTVIHGHNMRSGEMFGGLKKYLDPEYADDHKVLYIYYKDRWKVYDLLSVFWADRMDFSVYQYVFSSNEDFIQYVKECREKSLVTVDGGEGAVELLTLSTCGGKGQKLIVCFSSI